MENGKTGRRSITWLGRYMVDACLRLKMKELRGSGETKLKDMFDSSEICSSINSSMSD